jgi:hypothetical protein
MNEPEASSRWQIGVGALIEMFQGGLLGLVPTFERARINWRGPDTYDDYERVAEALFDSIVRDALANAEGLQNAYRAARYGVHEPGRELSRILVGDPEEGMAFFELESGTEAFDTIVCQLTDQNGKETEGQVRIPLLGARFTYEARFSGSAPSRHAALKVEL